MAYKQTAPGKWHYEFITPDKAERYLATQLPNRKLRRAKVELYARQIREKRFTITHQGIAFNEKGQLCDGQHRLQAIVESGVTLPVWVYRARKIDTSKIDRVMPRSTADHLTMDGADVTAKDIAVLRRLIWGVGHEAKLDPDVEISLFDKHCKAVRFAQALFADAPTKVKAVASALVVGIVARAYYSQDRARLAAFASVLLTGETRAPERDRAALRIRDVLINPDSRIAGSTLRVQMAKRIEFALHAFLTGTAIDVVRMTKDELFPIKGDAVLEAQSA